MAVISNPSMPRKLDATKAYIALLDAKDAADKVVAALDTYSDDASLATAMIKTTANVIVGAVSAPSFNKYMAQYIITNIKTLAPAVLALLDADIVAQRVAADEEATLNAIDGDGVIPEVDFTIGTANTYSLPGTDLPGSSGGGTVTTPYAADPALPPGLDIDTSTGDISGTATGPAGKYEVTITGASATKVVMQKLAINVI